MPWLFIAAIEPMIRRGLTDHGPSLLILIVIGPVNDQTGQVLVDIGDGEHIISSKVVPVTLHNLPEEGKGVAHERDFQVADLIRCF